MKVQIGGKGNRFRGNRGAVAVETAVILPILLLLLFGIVEFGLLFHRMQGIHAAAREAARFGSLQDVEVHEIEDRAEAAAPPFIDLDDLVVRVYRNDSNTPLSSSQAPCDRSLLDLDDDESHVRVELELQDPDTYGVVIPMWGSFAFRHPSTGVFVCEF